MNHAVFWKEANSRMPSIRNAISELTKFKDGSGALIPPSDDKRNQINLFIERQKSGKKNVEYIDPFVTKISFINENSSLNAKIKKKRFELSWNGGVDCLENGPKVECKVRDAPVLPPAAIDESSPGFRKSPLGQKMLRRLAQTRESISFENEMNLWTGSKTNVRDVNGIALAGATGIAVLAASGVFIMPALGIMAVAAPGLGGVAALANGETLARNNNGAWFLDSDFSEDKWISEINIPPSSIRSVDIINDDEFYFHAKLNLSSKLSCKVIEESDLVSVYPNRKLDCNVVNENA